MERDLKGFYRIPTGLRVPSVTTILDATAPKDQREKLDKWKKKQDLKAKADPNLPTAFDVSSDARARGSAIDEWCNSNLIALYHADKAGLDHQVIDPPEGYKSFATHLVNRLDGNIGIPIELPSDTWLRVTNPHGISVQVKSWSTDTSKQYAGTLDFVLKHPRYGNTLYDLTTTNFDDVRVMWRGHRNWKENIATSKKYPYLIWRKFLQITAYRSLIEDWGIEINRLGVLVATRKKLLEVYATIEEIEQCKVEWLERLELFEHMKGSLE